MDRIDAMQAFARVVETGSFTKAAETLQTNKTRVTQLIQQLETRLRVKLLHRTTRKVTALPRRSGRTLAGKREVPTARAPAGYRRRHRILRGQAARIGHGGDAQLERERRQYEAEERQRAIRENRRRIEESTRQSQEQLDALIRHWAEIKARSESLERLEQDIARLTESERAPLEARLALARELIGPTDPMPHFLAWRAPAERYTPRHFEEEE